MHGLAGCGHAKTLATGGPHLIAGRLRSTADGWTKIASRQKGPRRIMGDQPRIAS